MPYDHLRVAYNSLLGKKGSKFIENHLKKIDNLDGIEKEFIELVTDEIDRIDSEDSKILYLKNQVMLLNSQLNKANLQIDELEQKLELFETGITIISEAYTHLRKGSVIEALQKQLGRYKKGTTEHSKKIQEKWKLANVYFLEEKENNKTLKEARSAAAKRAGLVASERHLAEMMPNPAKNK